MGSLHIGIYNNNNNTQYMSDRLLSVPTHTIWCIVHLNILSSTNITVFNKTTLLVALNKYIFDICSKTL